MEQQAPYSVSGAEQLAAPTIFGPDVWAIVEIMGHKRVAGRIRKEGFGNTEMLVVETPELPAYTLPDEPFKYEQEWDGFKRDYYDATGRKVYKEVPALQVGPRAYFPQAIFGVNLCTEEEAREEAKVEQGRPDYENVIESKVYNCAASAAEVAAAFADDSNSDDD